MTAKRKFHGENSVLGVLVASICIGGVILVQGSPSPQSFPQSHSTAWMTWGTPLFSQNQLKNPSNNWNEARQQPHCRNMGISCSGHTYESCARYCTSVGLSQSQCNGSCCLCSDVPFLTTIATKPIPPKVSVTNGLKPANPPKPLQTNLIEPLDQEVESSLRYPVKKDFPRGDSSTNNNGIVKEKNAAVCMTEHCHQAAKTLLKNMNPNVNPCDNFYDYACGGFTKNTNIPHDKTEVTMFTMLRDKVMEQLRTVFEEPKYSNDPRAFKLAKTLYKSCMDTGTIQKRKFGPMTKVLEILGGWPVLEGSRWQPQYFSWANSVVWFRELGFSTDYFMKFSVEPDIRNVKRKFLTISEPTLGVGRHLLIKGMADSTVKLYYKYMVETAVLMGASRASAEVEMQEALNFEIQIAKTFYRPDGSRGRSYYNPMTISQLENKFPSVPWLEVFQRIVPSQVTLTPTETIMVSAPQYLDAFFNLITRVEPRVQSNYAIWRAVSSSIPFLHEPIRRIQFDFTAKVSGQQNRAPRWVECTETVSVNLANAAGAMYIRRFFNSESKLQALEMITDVQEGFISILQEIEWMDEATRVKAIDKARNVKIHVGYPIEHLSDAKISAVYSEYSFSDDDYFGNIRTIAKSATNLALKTLRSAGGKEEWILHGKNAIVNAFYAPLENAIDFPAAILQGPFFNSSRPKYMNYGAIGWVAGHELSHGFDDQGHQFDKHGNLANWWDPFTKKTYTTKTQCIIDQYGGFQPQGSTVKINGVNSQGENIADNGGIKQAYRGYQSWTRRHGEEKVLPGFEKFNPQQLFWLSAANNWCSVYRAEALKTQLVAGVHAPGEFRVRGTFANNKDFARDFHCSAGSLMNPLKKCSVW